jgi:hypothetical protein
VIVMRTSSLLLLPLLMVFAAATAPSAEKAPEFPPAQKVSLSGEIKLSKALTDLAKQTGIAVADLRGEESDPTITVECKDVTFWQALDRIVAAVGAEVDLYTADGKLALRKRTGRPPLKGPQTVSYDGRFRTAIKRITGFIDPETGETTYSATLEVAWEPTLQPFFLDTQPQGLVVIDDQTQKALPPISLGHEKPFVFRRNAMTFETLLPAPPRGAKALQLMEGKLSVVTPTRMLTYSFEPSLDKIEQMLLKDKKTPKAERDGVVCEVTKVSLGSANWSVTVTVPYPPGDAKLDTSQVNEWVKTNELVLVSTDGKSRVSPSSFYIAPVADRVTVTYNFDAKDDRVRGKKEDWKLEYRAPAAVVQASFAFQFKDVPLP